MESAEETRGTLGIEKEAEGVKYKVIMLSGQTCSRLFIQIVPRSGGGKAE